MRNRTLKELLPGQKGRVIKVAGGGAIRRRLLDMGVIPGAEIQMERYAPMGDPIEIKIRGYHLSLRMEEAEMVEIEEEAAS